jgi:UDP-glucuronate 4-epimerase
MSILVTGGAGFIGSHLLDRLAERDEQDIVCLDNFDPFYEESVKRGNIAAALAGGRVTLVEGDIRDDELVQQVFDRHEVTHVVHLAARAGVRPSIEQPQFYEEVNCLGTLNLLEAARTHDVQKFVFGSSSSVYGVNSKIPFTEDDPITQPISPYATTKRAGELHCHVYHHLYDLPIVCLRFFTVYGPRQRPDLAIHKFTRLMAEGEPIPMYGDGSSQRDYTYFSDIVDGIIAALERPLEWEIINLGGSDPVQLSKLIELIAEAIGVEPEINQLPDQPGDVPITYADIDRARRLLDYEPRYPIAQGIGQFVEWYRRTHMV